MIQLREFPKREESNDEEYLYSWRKHRIILRIQYMSAHFVVCCEIATVTATASIFSKNQEWTFEASSTHENIHIQKTQKTKPIQRYCIYKLLHALASSFYFMSKIFSVIIFYSWVSEWKRPNVRQHRRMKISKKKTFIRFSFSARKFCFRFRLKLWVLTWSGEEAVEW